MTVVPGTDLPCLGAFTAPYQAAARSAIRSIARAKIGELAPRPQGRRRASKADQAADDPAGRRHRTTIFEEGAGKLERCADRFAPLCGRNACATGCRKRAPSA
ncbi:MAG: hypothetical protein E5W57_02020 [Mesorhizobium sp.]|nr:MAG: hypothetical protein E5W57_02020 [Mesorhizobium sp.]